MCRRLVVACLAIAVMASAVLAQSLPKRQLVEELRLDATTEDFPDVWTVMVNSRGDMAVLVGKDQQFRFYDATGKKLGTFGRVGSGPGEFRRANWHGWTADTMWTYDVDQRRITYISPTRQLLRTEVLSQSLNTMLNPGGGQAGDGAVMLFTVRAITRDKYVGNAVIAEGKTPDGRQDSKLKIMAIPRLRSASAASGQLTPAGDTIGAETRTIIVEPPSTLAGMMQWSSGDGRGSAAMAVPFTFRPVTEISADGSRIGFLTVEPTEKGGTYTLKVIRISGEPIFTRSYPFAGIAIPKNVADSVLERIGVGPNNRPMFQPAAVSKFREEAKGRMPKFYPPVSGLHLNRDNTAWIQMRRSNAQAPAAVVLIDERGNPVATFDLPPRTRIVQASRDQIWAVVTDEDDLPSVVRYRVR